MLIGGTQRRALPRYQSEEMKNKYFISSTENRYNSRTLVPLRYDCPRIKDKTKKFQSSRGLIRTYDSIGDELKVTSSCRGSRPSTILIIYMII